MTFRTVFAAALLLAPAAMSAQTATDDPYIWLEDKDGARAMAWVEAENAKSLPRLQSDPRYQGFYQDALKIASAQDRIPAPAQVNGRILNFWRDTVHPHGIWRATTAASYATANPEWKLLLDLDALGKTEGKSWVWKGFSCLPPEERLCLLQLSEGGEDAVTVREFDLATGRFVDGGFALPTSKQDAAWYDKDTLLVARDWGPGTTTSAGYPFVVKLLKRGAPLASATEVYRGTPADTSVSPAVLTDGAGNRLALMVRSRSFFESDKLLFDGKRTVPLPIPGRVDALGMVRGQVLFQLNEDWTTPGRRKIPAGAVVAVSLADILDGDGLAPRVVFLPRARQAVQAVATTRDKVLIAYTDNVRGRVAVYSPGTKGWSARQIAMPDNLAIDLASSSDHSDTAFVSVAGYLTPSSLWSLDAVSGTKHQLKSTPARFDASRDTVEQFEARSSDGTKIPYFIVHRKDMPLDGTTPTIMTGYGGFLVSSTPHYSGAIGKLWIERGGSFVDTNIRGGGEFGPAWHEAGRKTKRQIIYDDFAAIANDLFARKFTSATRLGIYGGSNGGLLMGVEFNQHPDLWKAVVIQVPLLDMLRYEQIQAGASWVDEYGSVSVPEERAFLAKISPYQNLRKGGAYPEPFIWTTTKDDRVGPQHARKFAARMAEYGLPYLYYEDTAGGHGGDADITQRSRTQALEMVYFSQKLMDSPK